MMRRQEIAWRKRSCRAQYRSEKARETKDAMEWTGVQVFRQTIEGDKE